MCRVARICTMALLKLVKHVKVPWDLQGMQWLLVIEIYWEAVQKDY